VKIAAVCVTYHRPRELGDLIACFRAQDLPLAARELVILDDADQYRVDRTGPPMRIAELAPDRPTLIGPGWRLYSVGERFATLGEKRNAAARLVSPDVEALAVWDDDDVYLPWSLRASAATLARAPWSRPSIVLHRGHRGLAQHRTYPDDAPDDKLFQGGWAYTRDAFDAVGGYPAWDNGEDKRLAAAFGAHGFSDADPISAWQPFYVFNWPEDEAQAKTHLSWHGRLGYELRGHEPTEPAALEICEPPGITLKDPYILPGIHSRKF